MVISRMKRTMIVFLLITLPIALYSVLVPHSLPSRSSGELALEREAIGDCVVKLAFPLKSREDFERILKILFPESKRTSKEHVEERFGIEVAPPSISEFQRCFQGMKISGLPREHWILGYGYPYKLNLKTGRVEGRWTSRAELEAEENPNIAQLCITHWFTGDGRYLGTTVEIVRCNPRVFTRYGWFRMKKYIVGVIDRNGARP